MQVILVNGPPATGKTTLARRISKETGFKLISKDDLKDALVETGLKKPSLRNWLCFEKTTEKRLYADFQLAINNMTDVIVEANFNYEQRDQLAKLLEPVTAKEIYCKCKAWTMLKRYRDRSKKGQRAKVHQNWFWYPLFVPALISPSLISRYYPTISFIDKRLVVDTDEELDFNKIVNFVKG